MSSLHLNKPGALASVESVDSVEHDGLTIESAWLIFRDRFDRESRVFASRCVPEGREHVPVVIHLPGGGQTINPMDIAWWVKHGYACASFDWQIGGYASHDPMRKSCWPQEVVAQGHSIEREQQAILPLAIQAVGVVIDWMAQHPRVDADKLAVAGISWGGYLTWASNAHDPRIKAAVPVFGCGGLFELAPVKYYGAQAPMIEHWKHHWDAAYLAHEQLSPVCYLSSTNDFFGYHTIADRVLNALRVEHRRSSFPNNNHHVGPGEAKLALAWLDHYLRGGPAVVREPLLRDDWTIDAGEPQRVVQRELWWTSSDWPDDLMCWHPATPGEDFSSMSHPARLVFGRVRYDSGITLNTPTRTARDASKPTPPRTSSAARPRIIDGLGFHWDLASTQFYQTDVAMEPVTDDPTRCRFTIDRPGGGTMSVLSRCLADPAWNDGTFNALAIHLRFIDCVWPAEIKVSLLMMLPDGSRRSCRMEWYPQSEDRQQGVLRLRLSDLRDMPPDASWSQARELWLDAKIQGRIYEFGPIEKLYE